VVIGGIILLMVIDGYSINGYWWLFLVKLSQAISGYYINGYWWLNCHKLLVTINDYCWLFYYKPLVVIFSYITTIGGYYIMNYC